MEYIQFSRVIATPGAQELSGKMMELNRETGEEDFTVLISSPGGQVGAGIECYNVMKSLPFKITMHNTGQVDSISNVIFLAANDRWACKSSTFLFHSVGVDFKSPFRLDERMASETMESLRRDNQSMISIIASRTNLKPNDVSELFKRQHVKDSSWALENGLIQNISDPKIPDGAFLHQLS